MDNPAISYLPRPDSTPEAELVSLAAVYRFALDSRQENAAGMTSTNGDDAKGSQHDRARPIIPDTD